MELKLTPRLQCIADMMSKCTSMIDVGTDHAYLPIYLVQQGICEEAVASDINPGPIGRAESSIRKYLGREDARVMTELSDGLDMIQEKFDYVVIAGLGGETIQSIISRADFEHGQKLILQPMTSARELRAYLYDNGYSIDDETAVAERPHRVYTVMHVTVGEGGAHNTIDEFISVPLQNKSDEISRVYKEKVLFNQKKRVDGLFSTLNRAEGELERAQEIYKELLWLIKPDKV